MPESTLPYPAIATATAETWVNNWRDPKRTISIADIKGFFVPHKDVQDAMAEIGAVNVRMYIGLEINEDETHEFHLLVVGVDADNNDLIDEANGLYVYDFTQPCPSMCSNSGPLK
ncbi:MAG: hypothetical protein P8P74_03665 [Crocinitomicaceae bacterium]|nr:hypothetical protein [Crocinitomicaceae bacterium]